jgi:hypothetical protein
MDRCACARYLTVTCNFRFRWPQLLHIVGRCTCTDLFESSMQYEYIEAGPPFRHSAFLNTASRIYKSGWLHGFNCTGPYRYKLSEIGRDKRRSTSLVIRESPVKQPTFLPPVRDDTRLLHRAWFHVTDHEFHFRAQCDNQSPILFATPEQKDKDVTTDTKSMPAQDCRVFFLPKNLELFKRFAFRPNEL